MGGPKRGAPRHETLPASGEQPDAAAATGGTVGDGVRRDAARRRAGAIVRQLWWRSPGSDAFEAIELGAGGLSILAGDGAPGVVEGAHRRALARIVPLERRAVLLVGTGARVVVNGDLVVPVRVLEERDELLVEGQPFFFAAAAAAAAHPWSGDASASRCGRCSRRLLPGDVVVECASCGAPSHEGAPAGEGEALLCWSHADACAVCGASRHPWSPEEAHDA